LWKFVDFLNVFVSVHDAKKRQFADELIAYADAFSMFLINHTDVLEEAGKFVQFDWNKCTLGSTTLPIAWSSSISSSAIALDKVDASLTKFNNSPFLIRPPARFLSQPRVPHLWDCSLLHPCRIKHMFCWNSSF
jgi:hypothetical protein